MDKSYWTDKGLRATVQRLAAPAEEQTQYLEQLGTSPSADELALEFDGEFQRVKADRSPALVRLDAALDEMSGPDRRDLWSVDALEDAPEWEQVRMLARTALDSDEISA